MTNKNIAWTTVIGFSVFMISYLADAHSEGMVYWAGLLAFYFGVVYGTVRLFKSEN